MEKYLLIGLIVQMLVIILRGVILKKADLSYLKDADVIGWIGFLVPFIVIGAFNVVTWPLLIISEIINTIKGV